MSDLPFDLQLLNLCAALLLLLVVRDAGAAAHREHGQSARAPGRCSCASATLLLAWRTGKTICISRQR